MPSTTLNRGNIATTVLIAFNNSFAAAGANTTSQQSVTVNGLLPNDQISAVTKATFQAGLFIAYADVPSANTLRLTFANLTGGGITPTAGDLYTVEINRLENPPPLPAAFV